MQLMRLDSDSIVKLVLGVLLITLVVFTVSLSIQTRKYDANLVVERAPVAVGMSSRILIVGEVFWGRYARDASLESEEGYEYIFSGLNTFDKDKYDAWFAQLECPITDNNLSSEEQEATLTFNCRPEFLDEASKWFDVFSLANNHTDNMGGQVGLDETRSYLEDYSIQHYGHYSNSVITDLCEVVNIPINIRHIPTATTQTTFPVAMCGFHNVFELPTVEQLDEIKKYSKYFLTIITPQMGQEYVPSADQFKTTTFRGMIDKGADMVIASHPHWVQNTEVYNHKLIMYSVGNFMFDQQQDSEVRRAVALDLGIEIDNSQELNEWLSADLDCKAFKDDCLKQAQDLKLQKPQFKLSYDVIPSLNTNYVTAVAPEEVKQAVLERLNWAQTASLLAK